MSYSDDPKIQLLDDFWRLYYGDLPRRGNAIEDNCESIADEINSSISSSSLYNFLNERSSPSVASLSRMSYFVLLKWKEKYPDNFEGLAFEFEDVDPNKKDFPKKYWMRYCEKAKEIKNANSVNIIAQVPLVVKDNVRVSQKDLKPTATLERSISQNKISKEITMALFFSILSIAAVLTYLLSNYQVPPIDQNIFANQSTQLSEYRGYLFFISILHVFTIALLLFLHFSPFGVKRKIDHIDDHIVKQSMQQFQMGWLAIWLCWGLLYAWMCIKWGYEKQLLSQGYFASYFEFSAWSWAVSDILSVLSSIAFFFLFFVLDMESVNTSKSTDRNRLFQKSIAFIILICTAFLLLSIADRFVDFGAMEGGGTLTYSLLTAISMIYFFGRLDSHFFNAKRGLLAPLYLYSVLQVNWTNLKAASFVMMALVIFLIVFLLKIYFFFVITGWIRNGDFEKYFERIQKARA